MADSDSELDFLASIAVETIHLARHYANNKSGESAVAPALPQALGPSDVVLPM